MNYLGDFKAGQTVEVRFNTFNASGASVTISNFVVGDIEIYKGSSMTQRASDAGITLADTDGIDLDAVTGFHGFSINLGDNSDAGFYAAGNDYTVMVGPVTIDGQTVNFVAAQFSIENRSSSPRGAVIDAEGSYTIQQALSIILAAIAGVTSTQGSIVKTPNGVATRIQATLNASNERTAMTLTPSS